jgi:hypothetical protein
MTREKAIYCLSIHSSTNGSGLCTDEQHNEAKQMAIKALEQEPIEVEATKLQMAYNQGFEDCRKAVMDLLSEAGKFSLLAMVADLASINPQEPKYCDRNICIKNEYNGIGCDECEVTKSQEPKTGHWIPSHIPESILDECSECGFSCGSSTFNYCPMCGVKMIEPQESEDKE